MSEIKSDYLVIGAGAMGMAFTDILMSESDATVTIVDRHHQAGGHWNVAYPFVRLHQPSNFYGVNSKQLGNDKIDTFGWNKGMYELAGKSEICAYFDQVMREFISSGRVRYLPLCEYQGDQKVSSLVSDASYTISADKIVDASRMNVQVPAMAPPAYEVMNGVECVAPNALVGAKGNWHQYVVIGAGKTAMDACTFLLDKGVNPEKICWIKPRESWLWDRENTQPGDLFETSIRPFALGQVRTVAESTSVDDLFAKATDLGWLVRIDESVKPTMFRCATITQSEIAQLRRIKNVVRMGRVQKIENDRVILDQGSFATEAQTLFVDCTADGLSKRPPEPVFDGNRINLQSVRTCQQVFSAAFIAHIELTEKNEARKNQLCTPIPHPDTDIDYMRTMLSDLSNTAVWLEDESLLAWLKNCRLDGYSHSESSLESDIEFIQQLQSYGAIAAEKMAAYLAEANQ